MGKIAIDPDKCSGCSACTQTCERGVLQINEENQLAFVRYPSACHFCLDCLVSCDNEAIYVSAAAEEPLKNPSLSSC